MFSKYTMIRLVNLKCSTRTQYYYSSDQLFWLQRGFFRVQVMQAVAMGSWNVVGAFWILRQNISHAPFCRAAIHLH